MTEEYSCPWETVGEENIEGKIKRRRSKATIKNVKKQHKEWVKIFANYISNKVLITKIYK